MSGALIAGCIWVLAAATVAMLPMRRQYAPGLALLVLAPVLIGWIGYEHGWIAAAVGALAFVSMFRNPLRYLARKALGMPVSRPEEERE